MGPAFAFEKQYQSPVVTTALTNIQDNISSSSSNVCEGISNNVQIIKFGNIRSKNCPLLMENITNSVTSSISANCIQSTEYKNMIQDKITDQLKKLKREGHEKTADMMDTAIKTNVNVSQLTSCMASSFNNQNISVGDIEIERCPPGGSITFRNIGNSLVSNFMMKCLQADSPGLIEAFNKIPPLPPVPQPVSNDKDYELSKEAIIAISLGAIILFLLICFLAFYFSRPSNPTMTSTPI